MSAAAVIFQLPILGKGREGTVFDVVGSDMVVKVFHRGSETQRLEGMRAQVFFLSANVSNPSVPDLLDSGILADGDPYIVMQRLPSGLRKCGGRRISTQVIQAAESLLPADYVWTDVYNNAWQDVEMDVIYFNEGGRYNPEKPYNGDYHTLAGG